MSDSLVHGIALSMKAQDGITVVRFSSVSNTLLVSSWDSHLRLYDVSEDKCIVNLQLSSPILDCNFMDEKTAFSGGLDGQVLNHDFNREVPPIVLGNHQKPIKCVEYFMEKGLVVSCGWDKLVKFWDPRRAHYRMPVMSFDLPGKVYTAAQTQLKLVIGTSERHIFIFDLRNLDAGPVHKETGMQHQTRCVRCFQSGEGYGVASAEGRVAIEYFDAQRESTRYAFRCHRQKVGDVEWVYPVNAIAFHPVYGTFATGGCDGTVGIWDGINKKKITNIPGYPTSIASLDFNHDGSLLAIASSYTFEQGEKEGVEDEIYIKTIRKEDVAPKSKE
eukprot:g3499.t1